MRPIALVAPFFMDNTLRYVQALAELPNVRAAIISQDPAEKLPKALRQRIAAHYRVDNCLDGHSLARAAKAISGFIGPLEGLLGVLEQLQLPVAQARDLAGIPGMSLAVARNFRDKTQMKNVLRQAGLPCARHSRIESTDDLHRFVDAVGYPIIVKPIDGLGSRGTYRIRNAAELTAAAAALAPSVSNPTQAEEFVMGRENTFETVTIRGQHVWHSGTRYLPGPLEVLENPWIQYCVLLPRETDDPEFSSFLPVNTAALSALGMVTGLSHMEWFVRPDNTPVISEVGARPPGVNIMALNAISHEIDMVRAWVKLMVNEEFDPPTRKYASGCAFFRGQGHGSKVVAIHGLDQAQAEVGHLVVDRSLPTPGQPRQPGYEGEGWAIVRHESTEVVYDALRKLVSYVRIEVG
ncbi:MAG: ATP-grasp domain-containing protein [Myxococcales bacterium]|nr:ATP-grasp domain-containing protein [Myxococcales bacterium]